MSNLTNSHPSNNNHPTAAASPAAASINASRQQPSEFARLAQGELAQAARSADAHTAHADTAMWSRLILSWQRLLSLSGYYWVLLAQLVVVIAFISYLPSWLIGYALFSIAAQLPQIKARLNTARKRKRVYQGIQLLGFVAALAGLWLSYQTAFGVDVGVAFLLLCLASKLWELYQRRDAYVVLNLSLFVVAALFLLDQGLLTSVVAMMAVLTVLLALIALNDEQSDEQPNEEYRSQPPLPSELTANVSAVQSTVSQPRSTQHNTSKATKATKATDHGTGRLRSLLILAASAVPLLLVLFLFFPRLPPLWSVQLAGQQATTGVSDSMSPGDFANLSQSSALAFRVEFAGNRPTQSQLYWRGLVFTDFDGVTWTPPHGETIQYGQLWQAGEVMPPWLDTALSSIVDKQTNSAVPTYRSDDYRIILEPTQQQWLFALDYPVTAQQHIAMQPDFTLRYWRPVTQQLRYQVGFYPQMHIDSQLSDRQRRINLALPPQGNPQARRLAQQLFSQSGSDPVRYIQAIKDWINQGAFRYTLSPPPLGDERIDEFLLQTQAGFCEHYASSFTYLMRAAGIPARVVAGYQGGELGRDGSSWEVRQMDAHAWSEVWLDGQGWVRIDPTAFVAPERVEQGMDAVTSQQGAALFGTGAGAQLSYQQFKMLQTLRRLSDQASYYWQRDVVGYDQDKQKNTLLNWLNITSWMQQVMWLLVSAVVIMAVVATVIWYRRRQQWHPVDTPLIKLSKRLEKHDKTLARRSDEGMLAWLERLQSLQAQAQAQFKPNANPSSAATMTMDTTIGIGIGIGIGTGTGTGTGTETVTETVTDATTAAETIHELQQLYRQLRYAQQAAASWDNDHRSEYRQQQQRLQQLARRIKANQGILTNEHDHPIQYDF